MGVTALSITNRDYGNVTVTAHLVSGGSEAATRHILNDPTGSGNTFFGLTAPANDYITSVSPWGMTARSSAPPTSGSGSTIFGFITAQVTTTRPPPRRQRRPRTPSRRCATGTTVSGPGVLANDTDPDAGQTLAAVLVSQPGPRRGHASTPTARSPTPPRRLLPGADSFTYQASDGRSPRTSPPSTSPSRHSSARSAGRSGATTTATVVLDGIGDTGSPGGRSTSTRIRTTSSTRARSSTTTAADGSYAFTALAPGTYYVAEVTLRNRLECRRPRSGRRSGRSRSAAPARRTSSISTTGQHRRPDDRPVPQGGLHVRLHRGPSRTSSTSSAAPTRPLRRLLGAQRRSGSP